jgi:hypothetical protein
VRSIAMQESAGWIADHAIPWRRSHDSADYDGLAVRKSKPSARCAHIAALAIEHGLQLCSTDGNFGRFVGLPWSNPLRG